MRDLKYVMGLTIKNSIYTMLALAGVLAAFAIFGGAGVRPGLGGMMLTYCLLVGGMTIFSIYSSYMNMSLTMGGTRRGFFVANQLGKLVGALICMGAMYACQIGLLKMGGDMVFVEIISTSNLLSVAMIIIVSMCFTEFIGICSVAFGKVAMVIFMVLMFGGYGAIGGFVMSSMSHGDGEMLKTVVDMTTGNWTLTIICTAIAVCLTAISGIIMRKIRVKG